MPELPEVETTRRGIAGHVDGQVIDEILVRNPELRWRVPAELPGLFAGSRIHAVQRRGKYLLLPSDAGCLLLHLGMSGSLRVVPAGVPPEKHDHVDIRFRNGTCLRLRDPRRFGLLLYTTGLPQEHPLLRHLGPEPLGEDFSGDALWQRSRERRVAVKPFLMDSRVVVGVGNIYASEALFRAGIHPQRPAGNISRQRYRRLAEAVEEVLAEAIEAGGTTLRDFVGGSGQPGYFRISLRVYGRKGEPCPRCGRPIAEQRLGQRSTFFCRSCQT